MVQRIKQVLLTQYIGAIIIAFLAVQGIAVLIGIPVQYLAFYLSNRVHPRELFDRGGTYNWDTLAASLVSAALHLLVAYVLLRWLFLASAQADAQEVLPRVSEDDATS